MSAYVVLAGWWRHFPTRRDFINITLLCKTVKSISCCTLTVQQNNYSKYQPFHALGSSHHLDRWNYKPINKLYKACLYKLCKLLLKIYWRRKIWISCKISQENCTKRRCFDRAEQNRVTKPQHSLQTIAGSCGNEKKSQQYHKENNRKQDSANHSDILC